MAVQDGFLRDIIDHPDDDTPRLVFADWLEENGQPERAELIRVQCQLARLDDTDDRRWDLECREQQLLWQHGKHWAGPLRRLVKTWQFHRGFVEAVTVPAGDFLEHGDELVRLAPVRHVRLLGAADLWRRLARSPHLARVTGLDLSHEDIDGEGFQTLMRSRHLARLTHLNLRGTRLCNDAGMRLVASCPALAQLVMLDLSDYRPGGGRRGSRRAGRLLEVPTEAMRALAESPHLQGLRTLRLAGYHWALSDGAIDVLTDALLPRLAALDLTMTLLSRFSGTRIQGLQRLFSSPHLANLRVLRLGRCGFMYELWQSFAESPYLGSLVALDVSGNFVRDSDYRDHSAVDCLIAAAPRLAQLTALNLGACHMRNEEIQKLAGCRFPALKRLCLDENVFDREGAEALAKGALLGDLRWLSVQGPGESSYSVRAGKYRIGPEGAKALARCRRLAGLRHLDLGCQAIGDTGALALAGSKHLAQLTSLHLWHNGIGAKGATALGRSKVMPRLVRLDLRSNALPAGVCRSLRQRFGPGVTYGTGPVPRNHQEDLKNYIA